MKLSCVMTGQNSSSNDSHELQIIDCQGARGVVCSEEGVLDGIVKGMSPQKVFTIGMFRSRGGHPETPHARF